MWIERTVGRTEERRERVFRCENSRNCIHAGDIGECTMENKRIGHQKKRKWFLHMESKGIALEVLREKNIYCSPKHLAIPG